MRGTPPRPPSAPAPPLSGSALLGRPDLRAQRGNDLADVTDDGVVRTGEHRRVRIGVDHQNPLRALAADHVLDRAADPAGDVEIRGDPRPGLPDLVRVRPP